MGPLRVFPGTSVVKGFRLLSGARPAAPTPWAARRSQSLSTWNGRLQSILTAPSRASKDSRRAYITVASGLLLSASVFAFLPLRAVHADSAIPNADPPDSHDQPRRIRLDELPQHGRDASTQWVLRGTSVYDITSFVTSHPGGEVILRACGGSIDSYWDIFSIHQKKEVYDVLDEYYIGDLDPRDIDSAGEVNWKALGRDDDTVGDPFKDDPERDAQLIVHTSKPCNAETPAKLLVNSFLTPLHLFFVRNHLWVPRLDPSSHTLTIELPNGDERTYSLADLKTKFKEHTVTTTLQCAGNRRAHMSSCKTGSTSGLGWDVGAIGTADFIGVRLRDVLRDAGYNVQAVDEDPESIGDDRHVHLSSPGDTYTASVPILTALSPTSDVLLAYRMNGESLPPDHGGPLRAVVPGTVAARSVKWLGRVSLSSEEAHSQWQRRDYKCFPPNVRAANVGAEDWEQEQSIQETPVQSAITAITNDGDTLTAQGYAYSGGGRGIVRVDVSTDGGKTWKQAQLHENGAKGSRNWAWTLWSIELPKGASGAERELVVKAVDESYNAQPEGFDAIWNFRGLLATAWHRVRIPDRGGSTS